MRFDCNEKKPVVALLGAGSMGMAILKRIAGGKKVLLGDISEANLKKAADELKYGGYDVETCVVDAMSRESIHAFAQKAAVLGDVMYFIDTAGASPNQASPAHILKLDLLGTAYALDEFGTVIAKGGAGLVISSMTGYMPSSLSKEDERALAITPTDELLSLPCLSTAAIPNSGAAYVASKRANHMRVQSAAMTWGKRNARINTISPGIIVTPLAYDEFEAAGNTYQQMIEASASRRVGTSDEIAAAAAFLLSDAAAFITGVDLLVDGGMIAAINSGKLEMNIR